MLKLSQEEKEIIQDEEAYLALLNSVISGETQKQYHQNIHQQIYELRESLSEANSDEISSISEQIERLSNILNQPILPEGQNINKNNPYFGHMRLQEGEIIRDFFLGTQVFLSKDNSIKVLDWKTSPISRVFYCYEEDDEYEEEIADRFVEGKILIKRSLLIRNGEILRIIDNKRTLVKENNKWKRIHYEPMRLVGGSGTAARAETLKEGNPFLLNQSRSTVKKDKYLPEISALIDKAQFDLITAPESGIVSIQGVAGSGKTTVGLHRVAWLHYQDQKKFRAEKMMVMVFSKALSKYISKVLPALGVEGVNVEILESWTTIQRSRFLSSLPLLYAENTPVAAIRVKKHAALLQIIEEFITEKEDAFNQALANVLKKSHFDFPFESFADLPLVSRIFSIAEWVSGKKSINNKKFDGGSELSIVLLRMIEGFIDIEKSKHDTVIQFWEEIFSDFTYLSKKFAALADDLGEGVISDAIHWFKTQYIARNEQQKMNPEDLDEIEGATIDHEDDPILILFYQKLIGDIRNRNKNPLKFRHVMVDEAQDLSPIELQMLFNFSSKPESITLAGDINQKIIQHNGFESWEDIFKALHLKGQQVSTLEVTYRSTYQIMDFALSVLGDIAEGLEVTATKQGPLVSLLQFGTRGEMIYRLSQDLQNLEKREPEASIAVICATPEASHTYFQLLEKLEIIKLRYVEDQDFSFTPGIDITDVKQVKGLEFDYVILIDVDTENYMDDKTSRYLLHIGATRATFQLWIMNSRKPSVLLPKQLVQESKEINR